MDWLVELELTAELVDVLEAGLDELDELGEVEGLEEVAGLDEEVVVTSELVDVQVRGAGRCCGRG